ADAGSSNKLYGDIFFFEDFQNADVGDTASESAAEGQSDRRGILDVLRSGGKACNFASEGLYRPNDLTQTLHGTPVLPAFPVPQTSIQQLRCQRWRKCFHILPVFSGYLREVTCRDFVPPCLRALILISW